ncbi:MAG: winged helix-turn-helix domain-containing protein, partial [Planctomycetaceae bacterium]|nr:winged helix-turn-helix domain-containing protein [Planctomycetaceae bacterium]
MAARNEKARQLASDSKVVPPDSQILIHLMYEFNVFTQQQMMFSTGLSRTTISRRMNAWRNHGIVRGFQLGKHKVWTLTDLGARLGRRISNRYGPLVPFEPGKGPDGKNEAKKQWGPRNVSGVHSVIHDLHLASWVCRFVELADGDFRYAVNPGQGIIQKVTGEFGAYVDPPMKKLRRGSVPV